MKSYLLILPVAFLVAYSQIIVKWRTNSGTFASVEGASISERMLVYLFDPTILSAYVAALFASFAWLFVVTKLPLTVAFPLYIGVTFGMVILGGWFFLSEAITAARIVAIMFILAGIVIGVRG